MPNASSNNQIYNTCIQASPETDPEKKKNLLGWYFVKPRTGADLIPTQCMRDKGEGAWYTNSCETKQQMFRLHLNGPASKTFHTGKREGIKQDLCLATIVSPNKRGWATPSSSARLG